MREVQIQTGVQKNHRKVSDSVDADSFVIIKEQREQTQQPGDETKEQAKGRPKAREKGKTKDKSRGRGDSLLDQETTAEGAGGAEPDPASQSNGTFDDMKFAPVRSRCWRRSLRS